MSIHVCMNSPRNWSEESKLSLASFLLSMSKTPMVKQVVVCGEAPPSLLDKIPRSVTLTTKARSTPVEFYQTIKSLCESMPPTDLILILPEFSQLVVPEAIQSAALAHRVCDYSFFTENLDGLVSLKFVDLRHWCIGANPKGPAVMTKCSLFLQDFDEFGEEVCFDILKVLKKRNMACPLPSLACPLPLDIQPPIIPWKQVHDMIKSAMF